MSCPHSRKVIATSVLHQQREDANFVLPRTQQGLPTEVVASLRATIKGIVHEHVMALSTHCVTDSRSTAFGTR